MARCYVQWRDLNSAAGLFNRLPFLKRSVFRFERKFRVVETVDGSAAGDPAPCLPVPLASITSVVLSGELPAPLYRTIVQVVRSIPGCERLPVRQSGLLRNDRWARTLDRLIAGVEPIEGAAHAEPSAYLSGTPLKAGLLNDRLLGRHGFTRLGREACSANRRHENAVGQTQGRWRVAGEQA